MDPSLFLAVFAAGTAGFVLLYAACRVATRSARPAAGPATPELGPESPAVVNLLVNRWRLTEDAAEATLLDLVARGHFELSQPGIDPAVTMVHLPESAPWQGDLRRYEKQVLDRVHDLAVGGVVPVSALAFRDRKQARAWNNRLHKAIVAEARERGLSRRRFGPGAITVLVVACLIGAGGVAAGLIGVLLWDTGELVADPVPGIIAFFALMAWAGRPMGERQTPEGLAAAARWLGVRSWLRSQDGFARLAPVAVATRHRHLAYGAALGVTPVASAVLDLGRGDRRLVWSSYGGTWRRVRVRRLGRRFRYGRTVPALVLRAVVCWVAGTVSLVAAGSGLLGGPQTAATAAAGAVLVLSGMYDVVRGITDLFTEETRTGQVIWAEVWRSTTPFTDKRPRPWLHRLVVDDGTGEWTTAWALPSEWSRRCRVGDVVTLRARPWSRLVSELTTVSEGPARLGFETPAAERAGNVIHEFFDGAPEPPPLRAPEPARILRPAEVDEVFGRPMVAEPAPAGVRYVPAAGGEALLSVEVVGHDAGPVPRFDGGRAVFRCGDVTVVLTLHGAGRAQQGCLPWLVRKGSDLRRR